MFYTKSITQGLNQFATGPEGPTTLLQSVRKHVELEHRSSSHAIVIQSFLSGTQAITTLFSVISMHTVVIVLNQETHLQRKTFQQLLVYIFSSAEKHLRHMMKARRCSYDSETDEERRKERQNWFVFVCVSPQ